MLTLSLAVTPVGSKLLNVETSSSRSRVDGTNNMLENYQRTSASYVVATGESDSLAHIPGDVPSPPEKHVPCNWRNVAQAGDHDLLFATVGFSQRRPRPSNCSAEWSITRVPDIRIDEVELSSNKFPVSGDHYWRRMKIDWDACEMHPDVPTP